MIELAEHHRKEICALAERLLVPGTELRAYGSRVKGTSVEASDLDLMLFTPEGNCNDVVAFREALEQSNVPIFVQVFEWHHIPEAFKQRFNRQNELFLRV